MDAIASGDSYLPDVVLAEVDLVLRCYVLDRQSSFELLERLVRSRDSRKVLRLLTPSAPARPES